MKRAWGGERERERYSDHDCINSVRITGNLLYFD